MSIRKNIEKIRKHAITRLEHCLNEKAKFDELFDISPYHVMESSKELFMAAARGKFQDNS